MKKEPDPILGLGSSKSYSPYCNDYDIFSATSLAIFAISDSASFNMLERKRK